MIETNIVVLAIGHSARDTYEMLHENGIKINQKPFAIGARIEHPQILINESQYKEFYNHPRLGADRKSTRLNSSHDRQSRMPSSA